MKKQYHHEASEKINEMNTKIDRFEKKMRYGGGGLVAIFLMLVILV